MAPLRGWAPRGERIKAKVSSHRGSSTDRSTASAFCSIRQRPRPSLKPGDILSWTIPVRKRVRRCAAPFDGAPEAGQRRQLRQDHPSRRGVYVLTQSVPLNCFLWILPSHSAVGNSQASQFAPQRVAISRACCGAEGLPRHNARRLRYAYPRSIMRAVRSGAMRLLVERHHGLDIGPDRKRWSLAPQARAVPHLRQCRRSPSLPRWRPDGLQPDTIPGAPRFRCLLNQPAEQTSIGITASPRGPGAPTT